jgi:hypothetical protein
MTGLHVVLRFRLGDRDPKETSAGMRKAWRRRRRDAMILALS